MSITSIHPSTTGVRSGQSHGLWVFKLGQKPKKMHDLRHACDQKPSHDAVYIDYLSSDAMLLPLKKRAASSQSNCFAKLAKSIQHVANIRVFPAFESQPAVSMRHLGFRHHLAGFPCRPWLPNRKEVVKVARDVILAQGDVQRHTLSQPLNLPKCDPPLFVKPIPELPVAQRVCRYSSLIRG